MLAPVTALAALDARIIGSAEARFAELLARKAEKMKGEHTANAAPVSTPGRRWSLLARQARVLAIGQATSSDEPLEAVAAR